MSLNKKEIEIHPGRITKTLNIEHDVLMKLIPEYLLPNEDNIGYTKFYKSFVEENNPLSEVPKLTGLSESTCSAWASDFVWSIAVVVDKYHRREEERNKKSNSGFDIYEYAKTCNADYYDICTGYIYHIMEYNNAIRLGLPTYGIRVSYDGKTIGYAQKD